MKKRKRQIDRLHIGVLFVSSLRSGTCWSSLLLLGCIKDIAQDISNMICVLLIIKPGLLSSA